MNKTKKVLFPLLMIAVLIFTMSISAIAEVIPTNKEWNISLTKDDKMVSDFKTAAMDDQVLGLQPGDSTDIVLNLKNDNDATVDWYMTNKVIKTLEDTREQAVGGAYSYVLTFKNTTTGKEKTLFSSETVGGEGASADGEGLHEATSALGRDWFYLDTFKKGDSGVITLNVALDGETQGNDYQDTFAELQMNFAAELNPNENPAEGKTKDKKSNNNNNNNSSKKSSSSSTNKVVKTGDETNMIPYFIAAGISGIMVLILAIYSLRERSRQRGGRS